TSRRTARLVITRVASQLAACVCLFAFARLHCSSRRRFLFAVASHLPANMERQHQTGWVRLALAKCFSVYWKDFTIGANVSLQWPSDHPTVGINIPMSRLSSAISDRSRS